MAHTARIPIATPRLVVGVAVILAGLYGFDQFLASLEQREVAAEARALYQTGQAALRQGHVAEAIGDFGRAHALIREQERYALALADALTHNHELDKAQNTLADLLEEDSNDGEANLLMARVMSAQQKYVDAESYYHRAIYGTWPGEAEHLQRVQARLELVDLLDKRGEDQSMLAELLPLGEEASGNPDLARKIPVLFEQAGSLTRAAAAYRSLLQENPRDAGALEGLGRVELETGHYRAAQTAFTEAAQRKPGDPALPHQAILASQALALDPTPRRLSSKEKFNRSARLLTLSLQNARACQMGKPADPNISGLVTAADSLQAAGPPKAYSNEAAEERLDLAEQLWKNRSPACEHPGEQADLLAMLMRKLAQ